MKPSLRHPAQSVAATLLARSLVYSLVLLYVCLLLTVVCRRRRRCRAGALHWARRSPPPDVCGGPVQRSCPRRGPRVTWAGMARSPRRLPRRPADSPALPLQHTQRDSRPLMFRHDHSEAPTKSAHFFQLLVITIRKRWRPAAPESFEFKAISIIGNRRRDRDSPPTEIPNDGSFLLCHLCAMQLLCIIIAYYN